MQEFENKRVYIAIAYKYIYIKGTIKLSFKVMCITIVCTMYTMYTITIVLNVCLITRVLTMVISYWLLVISY